MRTILCTMGLLFLIMNGQAQVGSPEPLFGSNGFLQPPPYVTFLDIVQQADGRLLAVGYIHPPSGGRSAFLARYFSNGTPDNTFSGDGMHQEDFMPEAVSLDVDKAGRIILL